MTHLCCHLAIAVVIDTERGQERAGVVFSGFVWPCRVLVLCGQNVSYRCSQHNTKM